MKYEMSLPTDLLLAVSQAASNGQTHYYPQGVNVEPSGQDAIMVATDGPLLIAAIVRDAYPVGMPSFILPIEMIKALTAADKRQPSLKLVLHDAPGCDTTELQIQLGNTLGHPVDATFPGWRHVLPGKTPPAQGVTVAAGLVAKIAKAQKLAGYPEDLQLFGDEGGPCFVPFPRVEQGKPVASGDIFAVVMPIRPSRAPNTVALPSWVNV